MTLYYFFENEKIKKSVFLLMYNILSWGLKALSIKEGNIGCWNSWELGFMSKFFILRKLKFSNGMIIWKNTVFRYYLITFLKQKKSSVKVTSQKFTKYVHWKLKKNTLWRFFLRKFFRKNIIVKNICWMRLIF